MISGHSIIVYKVVDFEDSVT